MSAEYENPLCKRYASKEMRGIFSDISRYGTWRELWLALAEAQKELGLDITDAQLNEMREHLTDINFERVAQIEAETRHDVMAHIRAFGEVCPLAKPIIHLGATSCYVTDNADIILMRRALIKIKQLLCRVISELISFADNHKNLACLAFTHFQAAQPTTVGKRATLWLQDLLFDYERLCFMLECLKFHGCKGTTGTGASFLSLYNGDEKKVLKQELIIANKMGFSRIYPISSQTYSRKLDYFVLSVLSGIAQSAAKFSSDVRLMCHLKEIDEPFEQNQVGSSAMAYKKNPMRSERIASLSRYVITTALNPALTASAQWLERTLDDSANRRIAIPEAFLATDAILLLYANIIKGAVVYPATIARHLNDELPFMATENILMQAVKKGGDRQELHERIRIHSIAAAESIKKDGAQNNLLERIANDNAFNLTPQELEEILKPEKFTGMAASQVTEFTAYARELLNTQVSQTTASDEEIYV